MAAGRGEFFQTFLEGVESILALGRRPPGRGRGRPGRRRNKRHPPKSAPSNRSSVEWGKRNSRKCCVTMSLTMLSTGEIGLVLNAYHFIFRLPSEILIKILLYLDASSLFCISHVSKLFYQLASDDLVWHEIYMSEFGSQAWKPKSVDDSVLKVDPEVVDDRLVGHWKKLYLRTVAGREMNKWRRQLRDINTYTGLPRQTEWVLRNMNVRWELTLCDFLGQEYTLEQTRMYFFESSVIVRWSSGSFPRYHDIRNIQLYGVRKEMLQIPEVGKPRWRSLILKVDTKTRSGRFVGKDRLIKLMHLSPCFLIGIWRNSVAFIMASLHFHRLVEKSLLGSPPENLPPVDNLDPEFGLHGYTLHFNCCIMTLTLLDEFQKPFWCVSSPICISMAKKMLSKDYSGEHFVMHYQTPEGKVVMKLVWLKEQKQFFLISLAIYVPVSKVNKHFSTEY
uniref:F-box domain-containing protein n=1 Tax=Mola mola TaxID=94237 RepID=A0A3Q3W7M2_MOLML